MTKQFREQIRIGVLTNELMYALLDKMSQGEKKINKSELFRMALYRMAQQELTEEEFSQVVKNAIDLESI